MPQPPKAGKAAGKPILNFGRVPESLCISLTDRYIKLAYAKQVNGKNIFQDFASKVIDQSSDDQIGLFLSEFIVKNRAFSAQIFCSIPSKFFISKNVEIPSTDREEIAKIIDLQAGRFTPYSRDEIVIDFMCMDTATQHYTSVLLIIINRKVVERYFRVLDAAHISLHKVIITSEAMSNLYPKMISEGISEGAVAGIHIGEDFSDLIINDNGQMLFVRSISTGAEAFKTNPGIAHADFLSELNKSLAAYQDQGIGSLIRFVVLTGVVEDMSAVKDEIQKGCPIILANQALIKVASYQNYFEMNEKTMSTLKAEKSVSYFEVLASVVMGSNSRIDLTPSEVKLKRRFRESSKDMMTFGVLVMTLFLLISVFLASKIFIKNMLYDKLEKIHKPISGEARSLERTSTKNRVVRQLLENRGKGLRVFDILSNLIEEDVYLSNFSYQDDGKVELVGTAQSMSKVFAFVTKMEESNYFTNVKTKQTKTRREGTDDVADFDIEAQLAGGV